MAHSVDSGNVPKKVNVGPSRTESTLTEKQRAERTKRMNRKTRKKQKDTDRLIRILAKLSSWTVDAIYSPESRFNQETQLALEAWADHIVDCDPWEYCNPDGHLYELREHTRCAFTTVITDQFTHEQFYSQTDCFCVCGHQSGLPCVLKDGHWKRSGSPCEAMNEERENDEVDPRYSVQEVLTAGVNNQSADRCTKQIEWLQETFGASDLAALKITLFSLLISQTFHPPPPSDDDDDEDDKGEGGDDEDKPPPPDEKRDRLGSGKPPDDEDDDSWGNWTAEGRARSQSRASSWQGNRGYDKRQDGWKGYSGRYSKWALAPRSVTDFRRLNGITSMDAPAEEPAPKKSRMHIPDGDYMLLDATFTAINPDKGCQCNCCGHKWSEEDPRYVVWPCQFPECCHLCCSYCVSETPQGKLWCICHGQGEQPPEAEPPKASDSKVRGATVIKIASTPVISSQPNRKNETQIETKVVDDCDLEINFGPPRLEDGISEGESPEPPRKNRKLASRSSVAMQRYTNPLVKAMVIAALASQATPASTTQLVLAGGPPVTTSLTVLSAVCSAVWYLTCTSASITAVNSASEALERVVETTTEGFDLSLIHI